MFLLVNWRLDLRSCVSLSFGQQHLSPQVKRGHNIVTDRWAGACSPHPHPRPQHTHSNTDNHNCYIKNARFDTIQLDHHGPTECRTNRPTDKASYTVACPQLKRVKIGNSASTLPLIYSPIAYLPTCRKSSPVNKC